MKSHRLARIAETVREVVSTTVLFEIRDPRVKNVTVTRAEVSADLQHAKVYVSVMGTDKQQELAMHGLRHCAGFVQAKIAKRLATRFVPVLQFVTDAGVKKSIEISRILREESLIAGTAAGPDDNDDDDVGVTDDAPEPAAGPAAP